MGAGLAQQARDVGTAPGGRPAAKGRFPLIGVIALTVLALALRLYSIGGESLWIDEAYTLLFSRLPLDRVIVVGGHHEHPPLFYVLVHVLLHLHDSPLVPRLISAVGGTLSVPVLYALGARLFTPAAGLVGAGLLAISPFHLWHGQDGRGYVLAGLFVLLSYLLAFTALERGRWGDWAAYAVCTTLALYTEYTTALALLPQAALLIRATRTGSVRPMAAAWGGVAIAYAWWIGTLLANTQRVVADYWMTPPTPGVTSTTLLEILGLQPSCPTSEPCVSGLILGLAAHAWIVLPAALVTVTILLGGAVIRRNLTISVLSLWLVVPFAVILLISFRRPLFVDRIFLDATFPLYLLLGVGITGMRRGQLSALLAAAVIGAPSAYNVGVTYSADSNGDWQSLMHDLREAYRPGQAVTYYPGVLRTLGRAYVPAEWRPTTETAIWLHTYLDAAGLEDRWGKLDDHVLRAIQLESATKGTRSLWVVTDWYVGQWELHRWLHEHGFHLVVHEWYEASSYLELWQRMPPLSAAHPVSLPDDGFGSAWMVQGDVHASAGVARTRGSTQLSRRFSVRPGRPYTVVYQYQSRPFRSPDLAVSMYGRNACRSPGMPRPAAPHTTLLPIEEEDFQETVEGPWHGQPFGFVAPADAVCAVLRLRTQRGESAWRHVAVVEVDR